MKGQISIEAIMAIGMAIVILASFTNITWERYQSAKEIGESGEARMTGELLAAAINTGYSNGEGFRLYLGSNKLNFSKLDDMGVMLPIVINSVDRTIDITKNVTRAGGALWNVSVGIIPANLLKNSTSQYPELTVLNNGTHVIIYAGESNIAVQ